MTKSCSARIWEKLPHPVIDADGHWMEPMPILLDYMRQVAGREVTDSFLSHWEEDMNGWYRVSPPDRMRKRMKRVGYWRSATGNLDRATTLIPKLLHDRLPELGIDFAIVYPSINLMIGLWPHAELRQACARAYNMMAAELFAPYADRLTPVAIVPSYTPGEALNELEFLRTGAPLKAIMLNGPVSRTIEEDADWQPEPARRRAYIDCIGLESPYDYDPVWRALTEQRLVAAMHAPAQGPGWGDRRSPNNFVFNHVGLFAMANQVIAKGLFLGGVTHRFPDLCFAFLEGGSGWARNLYHDLIGHWEKRNRKSLNANLKPTNLDPGALRKIFGEYATHPLYDGKIDEIITHHLDPYTSFKSLEECAKRDGECDDFTAVPIESRKDIDRLFARNFHFGCEADDPMTMLAFDRRMGARLKAIFSSDISHWDVTDMTEVLEEAWELVEKDLISEEDFRDFTFGNVASLYGRMNPDFFAGTAVADAAQAELTKNRPLAAAGA